MDHPDCSRREAPIFNLFTKESLTRIERRIADAKAAEEAAKEKAKEEGTGGSKFAYADNKMRQEMGDQLKMFLIM